MIDFLKILVTDTAFIEKIYNDDRLIFHNSREKLSHFDFETIHSKVTRIYKGILFCFNDNSLEILFRPHYYFNDNIHNANDFTVKDCIQVINDFIEMFDIDKPEQFRIINLEFGVNVIPDIPVQDLITRAEYHGKNRFLSDSDLKYSKKSYTANKHGQANNYKTIKFYAKGLQFPEYADKNLFRFEVKSKKSQYINTLGISYLSDLLKYDVYSRLTAAILSEFRVVLILYSKSANGLSRWQANSLDKYLNTYTWFEVLQKHRNQFYRMKKRFLNLLDQTGYNIHKVTYKAIEGKLDYLNSQQKEIKYNRGAFLPPISKTKRVQIYLYIYYQTAPLCLTRICPVTGLNLNNEIAGTKYSKSKTLKELQRKDPMLFNIIRYDLLKDCLKRPQDAPTEIDHLTKQIRNRHYKLNRPKNMFYWTHYKANDITKSCKLTKQAKMIEKKRIISNRNNTFQYSLDFCY